MQVSLHDIKGLEIVCDYGLQIFFINRQYLTETDCIGRGEVDFGCQNRWNVAVDIGETRIGSALALSYLSV